MKRFTLLTIILILAAGSNTATSQQQSRFTKTEKSVLEIPEDRTHIFGYLEVPENRSNPNSNTIQLPVYIFKSRSDMPQKDPIIWLTGGPGSTVMNAARYTNYYEYLDDRDLILFEQRGTHYAIPHLSCPEWGAVVHVVDSLRYTNKKESTGYSDKYVSAVKACRDRLVSEGIDLNGYTTREIAADVEDLREALLLDAYNLYTISYGTKIAQVLMRDYPEHIRSVVMDSPLPLEVSYDEQSSKNLLETLSTIFSDCEENIACATAYPGLRDRFLAFLRDKNETPLALDITPQGQKDATVIYLMGKDIAPIFSSLGTANMPKVPHIMSNILAGDYSTLRTAFQQTPPGDGSGKGMRLSVWCAEEGPFNSAKVIAREKTRYPELKGRNPATFSAEVCEAWDVASEPSSENKPITSDIPALILNGQYDNITPTHWGAALHSRLPNSYHLIFDGYHHGVSTYWDNPCGMRVANAFFNAPKSEPNFECIEELGPIDFVTDK